MPKVKSETYTGSLSFQNLYTSKNFGYRGVPCRSIDSEISGHRIELSFRSGVLSYTFCASKEGDVWCGKFARTGRDHYNKIQCHTSDDTEGYEVKDLSVNSASGKLHVKCLWVEEGQVWPMSFEGTCVSSNVHEDDDHL